MYKWLLHSKVSIVYNSGQKKEKNLEARLEEGYKKAKLSSTSGAERERFPFFPYLSLHKNHADDYFQQKSNSQYTFVFFTRRRTFLQLLHKENVCSFCFRTIFQMNTLWCNYVCTSYSNIWVDGFTGHAGYCRYLNSLCSIVCTWNKSFAASHIHFVYLWALCSWPVSSADLFLFPNISLYMYATLIEKLEQKLIYRMRFLSNYTTNN